MAHSNCRYKVSDRDASFLNIMTEVLMWVALEGMKGGFKIGRQMLSNLRYANDIVLVTGSHRVENRYDNLNFVTLTNKSPNYLLSRTVTKDLIPLYSRHSTCSGSRQVCNWVPEEHWQDWHPRTEDKWYNWMAFVSSIDLELSLLSHALILTLCSFCALRLTVKHIVLECLNLWDIHWKGEGGWGD